eukprot:4359205-Karenia_brevis.AAC.1
MIKELAESVRQVGLQIHADKTKILVNSYARAAAKPKPVKLDDMLVKVLTPDESTMYLGRLLNISSHGALHDVEVDHRVAAAW